MFKPPELKAEGEVMLPTRGNFPGPILGMS